MPFKGDMRLGGPHDNEANLNGTSSDFDGVLAAGTVVDGPIDTSRTEYDYVGNGFIMPYSTMVYADGLGGTYSVETWGLQYLPAGWVTDEYVVDHTIYITEIDQNVTAGYDTFRNIEDGTGINTASLYGVVRPADGDSVYGPFGDSTDETASYYDYNTSTTETVPNGKVYRQAYVYSTSEPTEYVLGTVYVSGSYFADGTLVADQPDSQVEVPTGSNNYYHDGNDNRYEWDGNGNIVYRYSGLNPYGTFITSDADNNYYWDGNGGYYAASIGNCPESGSLIASGQGTNSTYVWEENTSYDNGTYNWSEYTDGSCGSYTTSDTPSYLGSGQTLGVSPTRPYGVDETTTWNAGTWSTGRSYPIAYLSDGVGGYYEAMHSEPTLGGFYSLGTTIYSEGYAENTFTLYMSDGTTSYVIGNGTATYTLHYIWDGYGGVISGPTSVGDIYPLGTPITDQWSNHISESYESYDGDGNLVTGTTYYFHDGAGSYTTSNNSTYS